MMFMLNVITHVCTVKVFMACGIHTHTHTHLPDVLPRPLQNHFLLVLQYTTHAGSWMPQ